MCAGVICSDVAYLLVLFVRMSHCADVICMDVAYRMCAGVHSMGVIYVLQYALYEQVRTL